jgi:hypothetical protein
VVTIWSNFRDAWPQVCAKHCFWGIQSARCRENRGEYQLHVNVVDSRIPRLPGRRLTSVRSESDLENEAVPCTIRFERAANEFLRHLAEDAMPPLLDRLSSQG